MKAAALMSAVLPLGVFVNGYHERRPVVAVSFIYICAGLNQDFCNFEVWPEANHLHERGVAKSFFLR